MRQVFLKGVVKYLSFMIQKQETQSGLLRS